MSKTIENLKCAFAGESQANRRYLFFADMVSKQIQNQELKDKLVSIFKETAYAETFHAQRHFNLMERDPVTNCNKSTVIECIISSIKGESEEYRNMYPSMAKEAREEGELKTADWFEILAKVERKHANHFKDAFNIYIAASKNIKIYTTDSCVYCTYAKDLFKKKNCQFIEIDLTNKIKEREELMIQTGSRTVPQIFIDDVYIGGFDNLSEFSNYETDNNIVDNQLIKQPKEIV